MNAKGSGVIFVHRTHTQRGGRKERKEVTNYSKVE